MVVSKTFTVLPADAAKNRRITASVGFVSPSDRPGVYLMVRNKRGWDIPGGHVNEGESALEAFAREIQEETACELLPGTKLIGILENVKNPSTAIAVYKAVCRTNPFKPDDEIQEIALVPKEKLRILYFGDKDLLQELLVLL